MSISSQTCSITAAGNGSNENWNYGFIIPYQADGVTPAVTVTTENLTTNVVTTIASNLYTIIGVGNSSGGSVTYPLSGSALDSNHSLTITRTLAYVQPYQVLNTDFYPNVVEQGLDTLVEMIQQLNARITALGG